MSSPGWYPDPGGAQGRFRFWDGDAWSPNTTADPAHAPIPNRPNNDNQKKSSKSWIVALAVVVVITAVVVVMILFSTGKIGNNFTPAPEDTNSSSPTISAWNETSSPTPTPSTTQSAGGKNVVCPRTTQTGSTKQSGDRLSADALSVQKISGWQDYTMQLSFSYDMHSQEKTLYTSALQSWMSNISVALLSNADGWTEIGQTAKQVVQCIASSDYYDNYTGTEILQNQQISVSGYPAWWIQANVTVDSPYFPQVQGDRVDVIIVDMGPSKNFLGMYYGACTIGLTDNCAAVDQARESLTVS
jgi:hypothetical protein